MGRKAIKVGPPGTPLERTIWVPELDEDFFKAVQEFPMRAARLWAKVMEGSVRNATIDFSWKDPLNPDPKAVFNSSRSIPYGFLDDGVALGNRIEALAKKMVNTRVLTSEAGFSAIEELDRLTAEVDKFIEKNPGKGEGASWVFTLETPFEDRLGKIAEMPLPDGRKFLNELFNDMMKIIETVDINLSKPRYEDAQNIFFLDFLDRLYGGSKYDITGKPASPGPLPS
jgi:hypothetical protein